MLDRLRQYIAQYVTLTDTDWEAGAKLFSPTTVTKQSFLVRSGEVCHHLYFVNKGLIRLYYLHEGEETTRYFGQEGEFVAALTSFLTRQPSWELMQAIEDTHLLQITFDDYQPLLRNHPTWLQLHARLLEEAYVMDNRRVESLICQTAEERYRQFITHNGPLFNRVPQHYIATYLGIKPETLSRIRRKITERDHSAGRRS